MTAPQDAAVIVNIDPLEQFKAELHEAARDLDAVQRCNIIIAAIEYGLAEHKRGIATMAKIVRGES